MSQVSIDDLVAQKKVQAQSSSDAANEIRENILAGNGTGDALRDFAIYTFSEYEGGHWTQTLRRLQKSVHDHQDEPVVMVFHQYHPERTGCLREFARTDRGLAVGYLEGEMQFDLKNFELVFPTGQFASYGLHLEDRAQEDIPEEIREFFTQVFSAFTMIERDPKGWRHGNGDMRLGVYNMQFLDQFPGGSDYRPHMLGGPDAMRGQGTHLFFGKEVVDLFFRLGAGSGQLADRDLTLCKEVQAGTAEPGSAESVLDNRTHRELGYVDAMRLLGREAPMDFVKEKDTNLYNNRMRVLHTLEDTLMRVDVAYADRQKKKRSHDPDLLAVSLYGKSPRTSWERQLFLSTLDRNDFTRVIEGTLKEAIELDLHNVDWTLEISRPGRRLEVAPYIQGLCKEYDITIPS